MKRPYPHPCLPDNPVAVDISYARVAAVRAVIAIVAQHKVFILTQCYRLSCPSGRKHNFSAVAFLQRFSVNIYSAVQIDKNGLSRHSDDTFDVIDILFILEWKNDDIKPFRVLEPIAYFIDYQIIVIAQSRLHRASIHLRTLSYKGDDEPCHRQNDRNIQNSADNFFQNLLWFHACFPS